MKSIITYSLTLISFLSFAQQKTIRGIVKDEKTELPLINAAILVNMKYATLTNTEGRFELFLSDDKLNDTLYISYLGYRTVKEKISNLDISSEINFQLQESAMLLDEVVVLEKKDFKFESKKLESSMKQVRENLYASASEVTNEQYNLFLNYLLRTDQKTLYEKYKPDISQYDGSLLVLFRRYHYPAEDENVREQSVNYKNYPVVNITHEAAKAYCVWLSTQYNNYPGKKKFSRVTFRLPTLKEWQIAALGYPKFQSWNIEENVVEVGVPKIPGEMIPAKKIMMLVKDNEILYPWYGAHDYRNRAQNNKNCWMGNFKIPPDSPPCYMPIPGGDGFVMMAFTESYFPNGMGLYDVVGNIEEMISEKGKACGGSWDHLPEESTMMSVHDYSGPGSTVGFRIFMDNGTNDFTGKYEMKDNTSRIAYIHDNKGKLSLEVVSEFKAELKEETEFVFKVKNVSPSATIEFVRDDTGKTTKFLVTQNGLFEWTKIE